MVVGHGADDCFVECTRPARKAEEHRSLRVSNRVDQVRRVPLELPASDYGAFVRKEALVLLHVAVGEKKAAGIEDEHTCFGFRAAEAGSDQPFTDRPSNANTAGACPMNHEDLVLEAFIAEVACRENAG